MGRGALSYEDGRNYPLNCWYVAATSDELGRGLLGRTVLGAAVLLYRRRSGEVVALEDRCAHRSLPLSLGHLDDDQVVCAYHGFAFAPSGECVRVPSQSAVPYGAHVRTFPIREQSPFVWIWVGDPARAAWAPAPPSVPQLTDEAWTTFGGSTQVGANYLLLHENALDLSHFPFVHQERSPVGYRTVPPPLEVEVTERSVSYSRTFPPGPLVQWQVRATGLAAEVDHVQRESGTFASPALHVDHMDVLTPQAGDGSPSTYQKVFVRAFTPVGPASTHVFWRVARNYALEDVAVTDVLRGVHETNMGEDTPIVEAIQAHADGSLDQFDVTADLTARKAHQIVQDMLSQERTRGAIVRSSAASRRRSAVAGVE